MGWGEILQQELIDCRVCNVEVKEFKMEAFKMCMEDDKRAGCSALTCDAYVMDGSFNSIVIFSAIWSLMVVLCVMK